MYVFSGHLYVLCIVGGFCVIFGDLYVLCSEELKVFALYGTYWPAEE